jgi:hypothetical protein
MNRLGWGETVCGAHVDTTELLTLGWRRLIMRRKQHADKSCGWLETKSKDSLRYSAWASSLARVIRCSS